MDSWMNESKHGWSDSFMGRIDGLDGWFDGQMDGWMNNLVDG